MESWLIHYVVLKNLFSFIQHNCFEIHSCHCVYQWNIFFNAVLTKFWGPGERLVTSPSQTAEIHSPPLPLSSTHPKHSLCAWPNGPINPRGQVPDNMGDSPSVWELDNLFKLTKQSTESLGNQSNSTLLAKYNRPCSSSLLWYHFSAATCCGPAWPLGAINNKALCLSSIRMLVCCVSLQKNEKTLLSLRKQSFFFLLF